MAQRSPSGNDVAAYVNFVTSTKDVRLLAFLIWYAVILCLLPQIARVVLSVLGLLSTTPSGVMYSFLDPKTIGWTLMFCIPPVLLFALLGRFVGFAELHRQIEPRLLLRAKVLVMKKKNVVVFLAPMSALLPAYAFLLLGDVDWMSPMKTERVQGNKNLIFFAVGVLLAATAIALRRILLQESVLEFQGVSLTRADQFKAATRSACISGFKDSLSFTSLWLLVTFIIAQVSARSPVLSSKVNGSADFVLHILLMFPFGNAFNDLSNESVGVGFVPEFKAIWFFCLTIWILSLCWRLGHRLAEIFLTDRFLFGEQDKWLLFGLTDTHDPLTMHLAFRSLCMKAETCSATREAIFDPACTQLRSPPNFDSSSRWIIVLEAACGIVDGLSKRLYDLKAEDHRADLGSLAEQRFYDSTLVVWAAQTLSFLAKFSAREDSFGVVQRSMSRILTSLLECRIQLEDFTGNASPQNPTPFQRLIAKSKEAQLRATCVAINLDNSLFRIANVFQARWRSSSFKLSDDGLNSKLQTFCDGSIIDSFAKDQLAATRRRHGSKSMFLR